MTDRFDPERLWVVSDTHFNHVNIIEYMSRPFKDVDDMREGLIQQWNEYVRPDDTVLHLGDAFMGKIDEQTVLIGQQLHGRKHLVAGNHDKTLIKRGYAARIFHSVQDLLRFYVGPHEFVASHYPFEEWREKYHIHGHQHRPSLVKTNRLNCNMDALELYRPLSFAELMERMPK